MTFPVSLNLYTVWSAYRNAKLDRDSKMLTLGQMADANQHIANCADLLIDELQMLIPDFWNVLYGVEADVTKGRPPRVQPALAFDKRHMIALVQVLALDGSDEPIRALAEAWGVEIVEDRSEPPYRGKYYMNQWATIRALAKYAIERDAQS